MTRIITTFTLCILAIAANAQEKADIEVSYEASTVNLIEGGNGKPSRYILLANASESKFYSPRTEYIDSLRSTPEGEAKYNEMTRSAYFGGKLDELPSRDGSYYVTKSRSDNKLRYYDINGLEKYRYDEEIPQIDWELTDSTKNVLGYECQQAIGDFHGRKWTAWFTPEIPLTNGPWKLGGLPGLILQATDNSGLYTFVATGIQQTSRPMTPVYSAQDYEKISRKDFLKAKRQFTDNPMAAINTQLSASGVSIGGTGNEIIYKSREEIDFIETDY
ncbi:MAG: GLPGLI family protein [Bacteroides sp.]|nr:GLPGLI family protein [Bacteroides sp.]